MSSNLPTPASKPSILQVLNALRTLTDDDKAMVTLERLGNTKTVRTKAVQENGESVPAPVSGIIFAQGLIKAGFEKHTAGKVATPSYAQTFLDALK